MQDFNPHSRTGSDVGRSDYQFTTKISTHTPARGVTNYERPKNPAATISTHTPARGVTPYCIKEENMGARFQPTLPHGE